MISSVLLQIILPFLFSCLVQFLVIKESQAKLFCIDCSKNNKPQRVHDVPIPRAGGLGIFVAVLVGLNVLGREGIFMVLASLPAFFSGFYEDMRSNISVRKRFVIMGIGAILAVILMQTVIYDTGLFKLPLWIAVPFTIFAIVGVTNAINIIDGFNGLASGASIMALMVFAYISYLHGDQLVFSICITMISAITGFLVWNFPKGKIFLGDGGAYFIGFSLVVVSILLFNRHPRISPLFPVVILAYPIFEVLFSIYRRRIKRGLSSFAPDRTHLHTLLYKRLLRNNPKTSMYVWGMVALLDIATLPFYANRTALVVIFFAFSFFYVSLYKRIVRFSFKPNKPKSAKDYGRNREKIFHQR